MLSGTVLRLAYGAALAALSTFLFSCSDATPGSAPSPDAGSGGGSGSGGASQNDGATGGYAGCYVGEDCNQTSEVCDPDTRQCVPYQCNATLVCTPPEICADQAVGATVGACYLSCQPFESNGGGCGPGKECRSGRIDGALGLCVDPGDNLLGQPCLPSVVSTDCVPGLRCFKILQGGYVCARPCDYWEGQQACPSDLRCHPDLACVGPDTGVPAALGEPCVGASAPNWSCAIDGSKVGGLCVQEGNGLVCRAPCRTAQGHADCNPGETCEVSSFNPIIGFCKP